MEEIIFDPKTAPLPIAQRQPVDERLSDIMENLAEVLRDHHGVNNFSVEIAANRDTRSYCVSLSWKTLDGVVVFRKYATKGHRTALGDSIAVELEAMCHELEIPREVKP